MAAAAATPGRWAASVASVVAAVRSLGQTKPIHQKRRSYFEDALMAREMDRL